MPRPRPPSVRRTQSRTPWVSLKRTVSSAFSPILCQIVDAPILQIIEEIVEMIQLVPQERIQARIMVQIADIPVSQIMEAIVERVQIIPQERVQYGEADRRRTHSPVS